MKLLTLIILLILSAAQTFGQNVCTVTGDYTFHGDSSHSPEQCRELALTNARINALAKEFGTIYTSSEESIGRKSGDTEIQDFESISMCEVKGEWLSDIGQPTFETSIDADGDYVVRCKIKGKARPISNEAPDFTFKVMRNGADTRNLATEFHSGDDMTMSVQTPVDGYLAIYLAGENDLVYSLFPYYTSANNDTKLRRGREYILFDAKKSPEELGQPDELLLNTDRDIERNRIFAVFSPNRFSPAVDTETGKYAPRELSYKDFNRWLLKNRVRDTKMRVKVVKIVITPALSN